MKCLVLENLRHVGLLDAMEYDYLVAALPAVARVSR